MGAPNNQPSIVMPSEKPSIVPKFALSKYPRSKTGWIITDPPYYDNVPYSFGSTISEGLRAKFSRKNHYRQVYADTWLALMRNKLGLCAVHPDDGRLVSNLLRLLYQHDIDYTRFFRRFAYVACHGEEVMAEERPGWRTAFGPWFDDYQQRLTLETTPPQQREAMMLEHNPKYILRQKLLECVIRCAVQDQDFSALRELLLVVQTPFAEHASYEHLA